jgi:aminopeptidase N
MNNVCISATFQLDEPSNVKWIKVNANMTGVYRVHYDDDNWRALIDQLWTDHTVSSVAFMLCFVNPQ